MREYIHTSKLIAHQTQVTEGPQHRFELSDVPDTEGVHAQMVVLVVGKGCREDPPVLTLLPEDFVAYGHSVRRHLKKNQTTVAAAG